MLQPWYGGVIYVLFGLLNQRLLASTALARCRVAPCMLRVTLRRCMSCGFTECWDMHQLLLLWWLHDETMMIMVMMIMMISCCCCSTGCNGCTGSQALLVQELQCCLASVRQCSAKASLYSGCSALVLHASQPMRRWFTPLLRETFLSVSSQAGL